MKAKLMALLLAVGLGVAGVAATVQAADTRSKEESCVHEIIGIVNTDEFVADYNQTYHAWYQKYHVFCNKCDGYDDYVIDRFEAHDYENFYDNKGNMIYSYCTVCYAEINY